MVTYDEINRNEIKGQIKLIAYNNWVKYLWEQAVPEKNYT